MIAADFRYIRPENLSELAEAILKLNGESFSFYGGGSEILSMARAGSISPSAVIDVKSIDEFRRLALRNGQLYIGAAVSLARIAESRRFPLLGAAVSRIADHTNQCRITVGGNLAGTIAYREAALPLLLADAQTTLFRDGKLRQTPLKSIFDRRLNLAPGEAVVGFQVEERFLNLPWAHAKRTRGDKIDYPLVTIAAMRTPEGMRFALSGICDGPFRDESLESVFSDACRNARDRAQAIVKAMPAPIDDAFASAEYRAFQAGIAIEDAINRLEGNAKC